MSVTKPIKLFLIRIKLCTCNIKVYPSISKENLYSRLPSGGKEGIYVQQGEQIIILSQEDELLLDFSIAN